MPTLEPPNGSDEAPLDDELLAMHLDDDLFDDDDEAAGPSPLEDDPAE